MGVLNGWVVSIASVTMIMAVILAITPKNAPGKAVALCGSIILTVTVIAPLRNINVEKLSYLGEEYGAEIAERARNFQSTNEKIQLEVIEEKLRAYILSGNEKVRDVTVSCESADSISAEVVIRSEEDKMEIVDFLIKECGLRADKIHFIQEVEDDRSEI